MKICVRELRSGIRTVDAELLAAHASCYCRRRHRHYYLSSQHQHNKTSNLICVCVRARCVCVWVVCRRTERTTMNQRKEFVRQCFWIDWRAQNMELFVVARYSEHKQCHRRKFLVIFVLCLFLSFCFTFCFPISSSLKWNCVRCRCNDFATHFGSYFVGVELGRNELEVDTFAVTRIRTQADRWL